MPSFEDDHIEHATSDAADYSTSHGAIETSEASSVAAVHAAKAPTPTTTPLFVLNYIV
ncbi:hypothetical protein SDRG_04615 [Saprolegnia diclina VS20]|uniref:Uncharacterized protein n=1 Tax=Saprolegnia diclina (strain VS20) TaxID=1156394 RepID=T0QTZ1_SAPDV|nr:hypothetical protein SDRG_04615 [Saprolegnia diclina VS20]EQC38186.1 hypothetical protein SDRG_04615 [Saprolegnia diclina VS20]|eukprot:XP_008608513.1 hypothetical protein SDRG_04615 [Saprolegnia diclina VS20]